MKRILEVIILLLAVKEWNGVLGQMGHLSGSDKYIMVPTSLIKEMEHQYLKLNMKEKESKNLNDGEVISQIPRFTLDLMVELKNRSVEVLKHDVNFSIGRGGGEIDLAEWLNPLRGDFFIFLNAHLESSMDPHKLKVYFISRSPRKTIEGEKWGSGCGKWMDISTFYHQVIHPKGWRLNSSLVRYVPALTGTFLFVYLKPEEIYVNSVTLRDSRYADQEQYCLSGSH